MPGIDRTTILTGPALVTYGGQSFWSKGDVVVKPVFKRFAIETAHFGKVDERFSDRKYQISFEPSGRFTNALAAVLWSVAGKTLGASILASTDSPLVISGRDGRRLTFHNPGITQAPPIRLRVDKTAVGAVEFTAILAKSTDPTNAAAYYTEAAVAYPGDTGFAVADIPTASPVAEWGSAPWDAFRTTQGWEITFPMTIREDAADGLGTYDLVLQNLEVSAKCEPLGPTVANVFTALKSNQALGTSLASADDLVISAGITGSPIVTLTKAALVDSECKWGAASKRIGSTEWVATRSIAAGVAAPLFSVTASA